LDSDLTLTNPLVRSSGDGQRVLTLAGTGFGTRLLFDGQASPVTDGGGHRAGGLWRERPVRGLGVRFTTLTIGAV